YVKFSNGNTFTNNTLRDGPAHVRADSSGNVFRDNQLNGYGYFFEAYEDPTTLTWTSPHDNSVNGGSIAQADYCFRFFGASDNHATSVMTDGVCVPTLSVVEGGLEPTGNTVELIPPP